MLTPASLLLKVCYCVALIVAVSPSLIAALVSARNVMGGLAPIVALLGLGPAISIGVVAVRLYAVIRHPHTLDAYVSGQLHSLRRLGIWGMVVGPIVSIGILVAGVTYARQDQDAPGLVMFVSSVYAFYSSSIAFAGCALFELSRLFGFEARMREDRRRAVAAVARAR